MGVINTKLIVANTGSDSLTVIDIDDDFKILEIDLGRNRIGPHSLMKRDKTHIYSVNSYDGSIYIIDLETNLVEDTVKIGRFPTHMEMVNDHLYVVNSDSNSITTLDKKDLTVIGNIAVGEKPHDIKLNKVNNKVYITNHNGYSIYSVDLKQNVEREIFLDYNPFHLKILDDLMFILLHPSSKSEFSHIKTIDLYDGSIENIAKIKGTIVDMDILEGTSTIYVTDAENGYLYEVDYIHKAVKNKYKIGKMPNNIVYNDGLFYITDTEDNKIVIFSHSNKKILKKIKVGKEPSGMILI